MSADFWLLEAPDSLATQSHRNPDGTGLGWFDERRRPHVAKQPISAFSDAEFASAAHRERSRVFVAHVRFATTGARTVANTHPFEQDGRLFAHNGVLGGLPALEARLADDMALVHGQTDSERLFALITSETRRHDGDVGAGIVAAVEWGAANLPVLSLNLVLATAGELFALRYPETNELYVLERAPGGERGDEPLAHASSLGTRVRSEDAARQPVVVIASEPMDADPGWRLLGSGELLHVDADLTVRSRVVIDRSPDHAIRPTHRAG